MIKIWHPELELVGESTTEAFTERNPFRLGGWVAYPATVADATRILGRQIHDLAVMSDADLIRVAKDVIGQKPETVEAILARVGDDKDLARTAREAEQSAAKPRKTLLDALDAVLA